MNYTHLISKLEKIIENWYDKERLHAVIAEPHDGLCDNIKSDHVSVPNKCIEDWMYFNGDTWFPVGGEDEYGGDNKGPYSLFNNPKRLHLAVHMLIWLRQHDI